MQGQSNRTQRNQSLEEFAAKSHVVACVDRSDMAQKILPHAAAIASDLGASMSLLRVLEPPPSGEAQADPIEWDIRRREARESLEQLANSQAEQVGFIETNVLEGQAAEQICSCAADRSADIIVLGLHGEDMPAGNGLGNTVRRVIDRVSGAVLLVPTSVVKEYVVHYRRMLVPLDGSARAESVLPLAVRLARAERAELILAHIVPEPILTDVGVPQEGDSELRERVLQRNRQVAQKYLDRIRARIMQNGLTVGVLVMRNGDARGVLPQLIADKGIDFVILSAHGHSGRADTPYGSVTAHLVTHSTAPILVVMNNNRRAGQGGLTKNHATMRASNIAVAC